MTDYPPRHGEGDHAKRGGGGVPRMLRPEVAVARKLRRQMSYPEVLLWQWLRGQQTGYKFRKQHPIGPYVADFCCLSARLVVEIDGAYHGYADDGDRDAFMKENGFRVLRVGAADVARDLEAVIAAIVSSAARPLHHASHGSPPRSGEDK